MQYIATAYIPHPDSTRKTRQDFWLVWPGETFEGFGGSRRGLTVRIASVVIVQNDGDTEGHVFRFDADDPEALMILARSCSISGNHTEIS